MFLLTGKRIKSCFSAKHLTCRAMVASVIVGLLVLSLQTVEAGSEDCSRLPTQKEIQELLKKGSYEDIEAVAAESRNCKRESLDGFHTLEVFYDRLVPPEEEMFSISLKRLLGRLLDWKKASPHSPTARVGLAKAHMTLAWKKRGHGEAASVSKKQWRAFEKLMQEARKELLDENVSYDAAAYAQLIELEKVSPVPGATSREVRVERAYTFLKKGIELDPDYYPLFFEMSSFLMKRWGGAAGEWEAFARKYSDLRGGVEGQRLFTRILWERSRWFHRTDFLIKHNVPWSELKEIIESIIEARPGSLIDRNLYCYFASIALDFERAAELFGSLGGPPNQDNVEAELIDWIYEGPLGSNYLDLYRNRARSRARAVLQVDIRPIDTPDGRFTEALSVYGPSGRIVPALSFERKISWSRISDRQHSVVIIIPDDYPLGEYTLNYVVRNIMTGKEKTVIQKVTHEKVG